MHTASWIQYGILHGIFPDIADTFLHYLPQLLVRVVM